MAAARIDTLRRQAPGSQRAALADGEATLAEYSRASSAARSCTSSSLKAEAVRRDVNVTIDVSPVATSADGYQLDYSTSYRFPAGILEADAAQLRPVAEAIESRCRAKHVDAVEKAYHLGRLSSDDFVAEVSQGFRGCLADAGVELQAGGDARDALMRTDPNGSSGQAALACGARYPSVFDAPLLDG